MPAATARPTCGSGGYAIRYLTYSVAAAVVWSGGRARRLLGIGAWLYTRRPYPRLGSTVDR